MPFTVTRFDRLEPLPLVAPVMDVFSGIVSVLLLNVMVLVAVVPALNADPLKLMSPAPAPAAFSSASRRLQAESVPVPGVVCGVQFVAAPASSRLVVTTRFGANCAVTLSGPFMVIVELAEVALATGSAADVQPTNVKPVAGVATMGTTVPWLNKLPDAGVMVPPAAGLAAVVSAYCVTVSVKF